MDDYVGWIKLSRKILHSKYYLGEKFTKPMCWIDLLLLAQWRKEKRIRVRGIEVVVKRGQVAMSLNDLHKRWNLSVNTVKSRIKEMVGDGRITVEADNLVTRITILNWEKYQCGEVLEEELQSIATAETLPSDTEPPQTVALDVTEIEVVESIEPEPPTSILHDIEPMDNMALSAKPKKPEVDCDFVVRLFHDRCPSYPKVLKLSDKRKTKIRIRFEEMGYNYETLQQVFDKAEASRFMRGDNQRGWKADFDWIFTNGTNWVKILEGKYDNPETKATSTPITNNGITEFTDTRPSIIGGGYPSATPSQRQKLSVLTTLAKIEQGIGGGEDFPSGTGPAQ